MPKYALVPKSTSPRGISTNYAKGPPFIVNGESISTKFDCVIQDFNILSQADFMSEWLKNNPPTVPAEPKQFLIRSLSQWEWILKHPGAFALNPQ